MLDRLFVKHDLPRDVFTDGYQPEQAVTGHRLLNDGARNLQVLFPPWHGGGVAYDVLIRRLRLAGNTVLAFDFDGELLKPDAEMVPASFEVARDRAIEEIAAAKVDRHYEQTRLVGMSLGNVALAMVASRYKEFDSATMVCASDSLAKSMWHGIRTQHIREGIEHPAEQEGHSLAELESLWHDLAPATHLEAFAGKEVEMLVSTTDEVIPAEHQWELVDAARRQGINPEVHETRLGHYAAIGRFCLIGS